MVFRAISASRCRSTQLLAVVLVAASVSVCDAARASSLDRLSYAERILVERALHAVHVVVDSHPEGKRIGRILVWTADPFEGAARWVRVLNALHVTTREHIIRREVLLRPGARFDPEAIAQTERNLRDPYVRTVAVVVPVRDPNRTPADTVDLLVVTRDVWSLRLGLDFRTSNTTLVWVTGTLSENNLAGLNKRLGIPFRYDLYDVEAGLSWFDPRVMGSRHYFGADVRLVGDHRRGTLDGVLGSVRAGLPLYSMQRRWGYAVSLRWWSRTLRQYEGTRVATYEGPSGQEVTRTYRSEGVTARAVGTRSWGLRHKREVDFGHAVSWTRAKLPSGFPDDEDLRASFVADVLPRSELASFAIVRYRDFRYAYGRVYDFDTLGLAEDLPVGPFWQVELDPGLQVLGSDADFLQVGAAAGWRLVTGRGGYLGFRLGYAARLEGVLTDDAWTASVRLASPVLWNVARVHLRLRVLVRPHNRGNAISALGGDSGLRGAVAGARIGEHVAVANAEVRTRGLRVGLVRIGGVLFYDGGDAFNGLHLDWLHSVGVGVRVLLLAFNRRVIRVDWAVPLSGSAPGLRHGVITAGFGQAF